MLMRGLFWADVSGGSGGGDVVMCACFVKFQGVGVHVMPILVAVDDVYIVV